MIKVLFLKVLKVLILKDKREVNRSKKHPGMEYWKDFPTAPHFISY